MSSLINKLLTEGNSKEELLKQVFGIRMIISSGYGDFGIASIVIIMLCRINNQYFI